MSSDAYARRQARARALGFAGYSELRRHGGTAAARVNDRGALGALPVAARGTRDTALRVLADMRANRSTLQEAAAAQRTSPELVRFWIDDALLSRTPRTRARAADRLYRPMRVLTADGPGEVEVRGSRAATTLGQYWNAVYHYLETGDTSRLDRFDGVRVAGATLTSDTGVIEHVANTGELAFESIYAAVAR